MMSGLLSRGGVHLARSMSSGPRLPPSSMSSLLDIGSRRIFNEESDMFRESVRRFMKEKLVPVYDSGFGGTNIPSKEIWKALGDMGLLGVGIPSEAGGYDGTFIDASIILEEQIYCNCSAPAILIHSGIVAPYIVNYGTPEQIEAYIPPMVSGDTVGALAMTEPGAGSDLQGIRTHAKVDGDDFILNGSKVFITNGIVADIFVVVAVTDSHARSKAHGLSLFLVPSDAKGFSKGRNLKKIGCHYQDTAELFFEDVRLPKSALLGKLNGGFYHLMEELPQERLGIGVIGAAHAEWMYEETRDYINQRKAFGQSLSHLPTIRHKMAELKTKIAVIRAFIDECLLLHNDKKCNQEMASMAKYIATDLENEVATECVQLHGGWGYMYETPIARAFIDSRVQPIYGGSNEIMKELISRIMDEIERCVLVKNEVHVYKIPPLTNARGYRAANWNLSEPEWTGRLRAMVKGTNMELRLEDKNSGELFAACPVEHYPGTSVEAVLDSSRYFVLCIQDSGRRAFVGIGFADRADSFDLNVVLHDHFKWVKRQENSPDNPFGDGEEGASSKAPLDLALKDGQTFRINIPKKEGGGGAKSRTKGTGLIPPPSSSSGGAPRIAPPPGDTPIQSPTEAGHPQSVMSSNLIDIPFSSSQKKDEFEDDDDWGEFKGGSTSSVQSSGNWVTF